ncbi:hypothetical protein Bbelb_182370 [Branchiostoma belcheri]|nr:hypothetical protein Bbelb_182370 [Branchiostoma belcheri]
MAGQWSMVAYLPFQDGNVVFFPLPDAGLVLVLYWYFFSLGHQCLSEYSTVVWTYSGFKLVFMNGSFVLIVDSPTGPSVFVLTEWFAKLARYFSRAVSAKLSAANLWETTSASIQTKRSVFLDEELN